MIIPYRTDYQMSGRPWVNYAIMAVNIGLFVFGYHGGSREGLVRINEWMLHPEAPQLHQFFSCMFLHGGWMHLFGNMVFLWVFGNGLNDRMGHVAYGAFYLAGGVLAGVGYLLLGAQAPVLGASGAISAVTGAYLVLLPRVRVRMLFFFYFITTFEASSLWFLLIQFVFNMWMAGDVFGSAGAGVAYTAHATGYVYGILVAVALLGTRLLPRDAYDLLNLFKTWRRRSQYRRMVAEGFNPFAPRTGGPEGPARKIRARRVESAPAETLSAREIQLRKDIREACARHDTAEAARMYLQLVQIGEDVVLSQQDQLDVANQLMADGNHAAAADAYERFVKYHGRYDQMPDVYLLLGLLYGRYLHQFDRAETYLVQAIDGLKDPRKIEMARRDLTSVRRGRAP